MFSVFECAMQKCLRGACNGDASREGTPPFSDRNMRNFTTQMAGTEGDVMGMLLRKGLLMSLPLAWVLISPIGTLGGAAAVFSVFECAKRKSLRGACDGDASREGTPPLVTQHA